MPGVRIHVGLGLPLRQRPERRAEGDRRERQPDRSRRPDEQSPQAKGSNEEPGHVAQSAELEDRRHDDGLGIRNVYVGEYVSSTGNTVTGESLQDLLAAADPEAEASLTAAINATMVELGQIKASAEAGFSYDQMLEQGNEAGEALIMSAVDALVNQTRHIERAVAALELDTIGFEGSDSLDNPEAVFE